VTQQLVVHGPFKAEYTLSRAKIKCIDSSHGHAFWKRPDVASLASKQGVYVFVLKASQGYTPVYVGKSTKGFKDEIFEPQKLNHYGNALAQGPKGTPMFFFVAPAGTLRKVPVQVCDEVETFLIQLAVRKNPHLRNDKKTKLAQWTVKGVVRSGPGKRSSTEKAFGKMIRLP
jgi:hypothetical protein